MELDLAVFNQDNALPGSLGRCAHVRGNTFQVLTALAYPHHGGSIEATCEVYTLTRVGGLTPLPSQHMLNWGERLPHEKLVCKSISDQEGLVRLEERLKQGEPVQVFVFNGDSDCVRHYLVLPLPPAAPWLPD